MDIYDVSTTQILHRYPQNRPVCRWKSKIPPPVTINVSQNFYAIFIRTAPVRIEKTTGYSGREMNEIYWKLVSRAAHPLINQLLWLKRNETELQFGLNNFHSGFWRKPPYWSILIFLSDWFNFAEFSLADSYDFQTKNDFWQSTVWFYFINYSRSFRIILSKRKTITSSTIYRTGTVYDGLVRHQPKKSLMICLVFPFFVISNQKREHIS